MKKLLSDKEREGFELATGVMTCLGLYYIIGVIVLSIYSHTIKPVDDSDLNKHTRSGLEIYTDYKTGVQYLSDGQGGLVKREDK